MHVLAHLHHEPHVVLDEEDRQLALVAQPPDEADELVDLLVVEATGRFVE